MEIYGPLRHLWCMRYGACHQYYKKVAKINNNFKNIALTLAKRHQYKKCWLMSGSNALPAEVIILGRQSTLCVATPPNQLQQVILDTFSVNSQDATINYHISVMKAELTKSKPNVADKPARRATSRLTAKFLNSHVTITTPSCW